MPSSKEAYRFLRSLGASFLPAKGSHVRVELNGRMTVLPMHGKKELGTGLWRKILKDLAIGQAKK